MKISLIALDMDGTFLNDKKEISEENRNALLACAEQGIELVIATGRIVGGVRDILSAIPAIRYVIATNGAVVMDTRENTVIHTCCISPELAVQIMKMARDSEDDIMYDVYLDGVGYTTEAFLQNVDRYVPTPEVAALVRKTRRGVKDHILYMEETGKAAEKINMFFQSETARERMRQQLAQIPGILVCSSIGNNLEINAEGADKGSALVGLADALGIAREETMAFGDGENDISMLRQAGFGVAMDNAEESVKTAADYITGNNNESGIASAIRKFVLI